MITRPSLGWATGTRTSMPPPRIGRPITAIPKIRGRCRPQRPCRRRRKLRPSRWLQSVTCGGRYSYLHLGGRGQPRAHLPVAEAWDEYPGCDEWHPCPDQCAGHPTTALLYRHEWPPNPSGSAISNDVVLTVARAADPRIYDPAAGADGERGHHGHLHRDCRGQPCAYLPVAKERDEHPGRDQFLAVSHQRGCQLPRTAPTTAPSPPTRAAPPSAMMWF